MACKAEVERRISSYAHNPALAEEICAEAISRIFKFARRHGDEEPIVNVKGLFLTTARHLLLDAEWRKLKADRVETVSWDADESLWNSAIDSSAREIEQRIEAAELKEIALRDATPAHKALFEMWFERGMDPSDIATELHITATAVRVRIRKLCAMMREAAGGQVSSKE